MTHTHKPKTTHKKNPQHHTPTEEPTPKDMEALDSEDETVGEEEIRKALESRGH